MSVQAEEHNYFKMQTVCRPSASKVVAARRVQRTHVVKPVAAMNVQKAVAGLAVVGTIAAAVAAPVSLRIRPWVDKMLQQRIRGFGVSAGDPDLDFWSWVCDGSRGLGDRSHGGLIHQSRDR